MKSYLGLIVLIVGVTIGIILHIIRVPKIIQTTEKNVFTTLLQTNICFPYAKQFTSISEKLQQSIVKAIVGTENPPKHLSSGIAAYFSSLSINTAEDSEAELLLGSGMDDEQPSYLAQMAEEDSEAELLLLGSGIDECQFMVEKTNAPKIGNTSLIEGLDELSSLDIPDYPYIAHHHTIKPNQYLGNILKQYQIPYQDIDLLAKRSRAVFRVTRLRTKKAYTVLCDSTNRAQYLVYKDQPTNYVVFALQDSLQTYICQREPEVKLQVGAGVIRGSLSSSMRKNNINPAVANQLGEMFAWTVDFFRLRKGDQYKVVYEEKFLDGKSVGIGEVKAAFLEHMGSEQYAFTFEQNGSIDFFDETGGSLEKAFLQAPLKYRRISSHYNKKRFHPVLRRTKPHLGTDYAAPTGTPIVSVGDGVVLQASYTGGNGNYVKIRHNSKYTTQYLHMSKVGAGIRSGVKVKQGQVIGYVGSTGLATGPHLCYRFWKNGQQVDPYKEEMPRAESVQKKHLADYQDYITPLKMQLDKIEVGNPTHKEEEPAIVQVMGLDRNRF